MWRRAERYQARNDAVQAYASVDNVVLEGDDVEENAAKAWVMTNCGDGESTAAAGVLKPTCRVVFRLHGASEHAETSGARDTQKPAVVTPTEPARLVVWRLGSTALREATGDCALTRALLGSRSAEPPPCEPQDVAKHDGVTDVVPQLNVLSVHTRPSLQMETIQHGAPEHVDREHAPPPTSQMTVASDGDRRNCRPQEHGEAYRTPPPRPERPPPPPTQRGAREDNRSKSGLCFTVRFRSTSRRGRLRAHTSRRHSTEGCATKVLHQQCYRACCCRQSSMDAITFLGRVH